MRLGEIYQKPSLDFNLILPEKLVKIFLLELWSTKYFKGILRLKNCRKIKENFNLSLRYVRKLLLRIFIPIKRISQLFEYSLRKSFFNESKTPKCDPKGVSRAQRRLKHFFAVFLNIINQNTLHKFSSQPECPSRNKSYTL